MTPRPLALTDAQLSTVHAAAKFVRIEQRDSFLRAVADHLVGIEVNDVSIANAVETVLRMWVREGAPCANE